MSNAVDIQDILCFRRPVDRSRLWISDQHDEILRQSASRHERSSPINIRISLLSLKGCKLHVNLAIDRPNGRAVGRRPGTRITMSYPSFTTQHYSPEGSSRASSWAEAAARRFARSRTAARRDADTQTDRPTRV